MINHYFNIDENFGDNDHYHLHFTFDFASKWAKSQLPLITWQLVKWIWIILVCSNLSHIFYAPERMIRGILFFCPDCLFVCLFVCLLSALIFAIIFKLSEIEISYSAFILYWWYPFKWQQGRWLLCSKIAF